MKRLPGSTIRWLCAASILAAAGHAAAQGYPVKPIRMIVPSAPGGSVDTLARIVAQKMTESLGQQVIVENRSGSGGVVGTELVAKAAPDGYTLLMAYGSHVINPSLYRKLPYETVRDFAPITQVAVQPLMVNIHPSLPARTVKELIALARKRPGELNYGSAGSGSGGHLATEILGTMAEIKMVHVPYKGSAPAMFDVVAGNTQLMIATLITSLPHVRSGRLLGIGVTSAQRSPIAPDVPTVAETIPGYEVVVSYFLLAPAGTPKEIISALNGAAVKALKQPDVVERLARDGAAPVANSAAETGRYIADEIVKWGKAVKAAGAQSD
ncbi:MAG: tripartite tricarboxylate transporter substrate binding protein [Betaproteobacteria bacterium]|nr:tripartite tricarboxylate transporter substrate binding protein [Betaproteobacteria bacterium]